VTGRVAKKHFLGNAVGYRRRFRWYIVDVYLVFLFQENAFMDDSFRRFVEECDTFQVRPLLSVCPVRSCVIEPGRAFNFAQTVLPLVPSLIHC
jgi:hypothetical protein